MRRALLLLLAVLLSFKAVAAGVVPIVGAPGHLHTTVSDAPQVTANAMATDPASSATHVGCSGHPVETAIPAEGLHEHACPHLGMATATGPLICLEVQSVPPEVTPQRTARFSSVDLDVPSPPPTSIG